MSGLKECKWFFVFYVGATKIYEFDGCRIYMKHPSRKKLPESAKHIPHNHKFIFIKIIKKYASYGNTKKQDAKYSASLDTPP